jgi:competence protein ComEA
MKPPASPSAFERLREVFRPPGSFGAATGTPPPGPPAASLRASPDAPEQWGDAPARRFRFDPGMPGIRVLALAGLLAAVLAGVFLWWSRPRPRPAPAPVVRPAAARPVPSASAASAVSPSPTGSPLVVDVAGKVHHPGVVTLSAGARVIDAINAAGGVRSGAKTGTLNLARRVVDGEQILVGITPSPSAPLPPDDTTGSATAPAAPVDLNTATAAQLDQLPGVGPVLAQRIVDYRTQHNGFRSVDELREVSGIGEAKYADLKNLVRV